MISAVLAAGVFFAVPVVGRWVVGPLRSPVPAIARPSIWVCAGIAIWSVPLLGSAVLGLYRPEVIGGLGWVTIAILLVAGRLDRPRLLRLGRWDMVVLVGVVLAAVLAAAFAADPFTTGRDMGVYANHAVYMVHHGRLDVPYPDGITGVMPPGLVPFAGVHLTEPIMTVRFGHLFPTWLAQTFAVTGYTGLVRLNVVLGALSLLAIYGLGRRLLPAAVASVFTLFLAFNPSQIWTTRNTLTEVLTQLLVWTAVLLLTAYLARGQTRIGLWAGILLGLSAVVRIDALLLLPLLLVAHALWVVVSARGKPSQDQSWAPIYLGAVPIFVVAVAYYAVFSRPYLLDLEPQLRQIGLLTVVAGVLLGLSFVPDASRIVHRVIVGRAFYLVLIVGLAALAGYAYVLRPILPPFGVIDAPGHPLDGTRSHVEDALPNLAVYLSPPVIGAAVAGWWFTFVDATHGRRERVLLPLLLLGIGFSVGYIWSQSIYPDHFWAIRRFVPVVIPSFLLFAGIGLTVGLRLLSGRLRRTVLTLTTVVLAATTFLLGVSTYFVTEREGSYAALTEFASSISPDETFLGLADQFESNAWFTPLYLAFDRHIVPIDVTTAEGRAEAIGRLQTASPGNPIALVTTRVDEMAAVTGPRRAETHVSRPLIVVTTKPVPRLVWQEAVTLTSVQATGLSTTSVRFGGQPSWLVAESGFYDPEVTEGSSGRWTDGHGRLDIPVAGPLPTLVTVSLAETGPQGSDVRLVLNGSVLFDGHVAAGPWSGAFEAVGIQPDGMASLEIVSNTFHPETPTPGLEVEGELGVKVDGVVLIAGRE